MKNFIFIFCFLIVGRVAICQEKSIGSFSWLYGTNGKLIADQNIKIDSALELCQSQISDYSDYLHNRTILLNRINPSDEMINNGESATVILRVYLKKVDFSKYVVEKVIQEDHSINFQNAIVSEIQSQLLGTDLYSVCGGDYFFIHLPIRFELKLVDMDQEIGIKKEISDGWFSIITSTNYLTTH